MVEAFNIFSWLVHFISCRLSKVRLYNYKQHVISSMEFTTFVCRNSWKCCTNDLFKPINQSIKVGNSKNLLQNCKVDRCICNLGLLSLQCHFLLLWWNYFSFIHFCGAGIWQCAKKILWYETNGNNQCYQSKVIFQKRLISIENNKYQTFQLEIETLKKMHYCLVFTFIQSYSTNQTLYNVFWPANQVNILPKGTLCFMLYYSIIIKNFASSLCKITVV